MILPLDENVSVVKLASVFNNTTATYKFYWFLSLIESVEAGGSEVSKRELFARMIGISWYTIHYFHVSFGKQDLLQEASHGIRNLLAIDVDERKENVSQRIADASDPRVLRLLDHFDKNVPHKFLSPWLGSGERGEVYASSQKGAGSTPYSLHERCIRFRENWHTYIRRHAHILRNFCYWNLAIFLQSRNPNVPDIPSKLIKPVQRKPLNRQRREYWDLVIGENGPLTCLYTGKRLGVGGYDVDHFIPFQFVAHDLMWNLVPSDPSFNSVKGDRLPLLDRYLNGFFDLQREGYETMRRIHPKSRFLDEYLSVFPDRMMTMERMRDTLQPILSIAHNNGFQYMN
jgi:5-methylcytosine-specific restriction endonuclease McrA